jgi:hypothetical protein
MWCETPHNILVELRPFTKVQRYTNKKRKKDYFSQGFEKSSVLVLESMHMQCGLMSETSARLGLVTLKICA